MCADVSIHCGDEGYNPHAHLLVTVRPLDEQGHWQYKTQKEYLCVRDGIEQGFTATEYAAAKTLGWEKQYLYKVGKKKVYMTADDGLACGYKRVDKHPKSTKFGRQNPITARWNSEEQLMIWREQWANAVNTQLMSAGLDERIDHRSFADRGITAQPTIHEGVIARALEAKGIVSERCEINRMIKADNMKMKTAKSAEIASAAEALETIRDKMILLQYQIHFNDHQRDSIKSFITGFEPDMERYHAKKNEIAVLKEKRKGLQADLQSLGIAHPIQAAKLKRQITEIELELSDKTGERNILLTKLQCRDVKDAKALDHKIKMAKDTHSTILGKQPKLHEQLRQCRADYRQLIPIDGTESIVSSGGIRAKHQAQVEAKLAETYGNRFDSQLYLRCTDEVDAIICEEHGHQVERAGDNGRSMNNDDHHRQHDDAR